MRRFTNNSAVILSNPRPYVSRYKDQTFTVEIHEPSNGKLPYLIRNERGTSLWVAAKELSPKPTDFKSPEPVVEISEEVLEPVEILPEVDLSIEKNLNKHYCLAKGFKPGDKIRIDFIPTAQMQESLGLSENERNWIEDYSENYQKHVGKEGTITRIDWPRSPHHESNQHVFGAFVYFTLPDGEVKHTLAIGLSLLESKRVFYSFQASEDRELLIFEDSVFIDENHYTFEFFEELYKTIREHKVNPRTGFNRTIQLENRWSGSLHDTYIQVGCQRFPYDNIKRLIAAIRTVKSITAKK